MPSASFIAFSHYHWFIYCPLLCSVQVFIGVDFSGFKFWLYAQLNIVEGKMQYLFDEDGRRYLDAFAGIVTVSCGHCHPDVLNAIIEQSILLQHATTIYLHHAIGDFAEALASKMPGNLKVFFNLYLQMIS